MNRSKILIIILTMILALSFAGCGGKADNSSAGESGAVTEESNSAAPAADEESGTAKEPASGSDPAAEAEPAQAAGSDAEAQTVAVVSKSDSTITQAEKKKVLDELSSEVDSLIVEVNKSDAADNADLN